MNWGCGYGEKEHPVTHQTHFHQGIDFLCPEGTPILATARGKVVFAGVKPAYGKVVIIQHVENIQTLYAHLQSITVRNGQNVEKNTIIGYSGTTGIVLSPSLHYEIRIHEKPVNPFYYLQVLLNEEQKEEAQKQLTQCHVSLD
jgi:murein DD-endopeptidase MepM/ murein hydrolase activator NlpD